MGRKDGWKVCQKVRNERMPEVMGGEKSRCEEKDGRRGSGRKVYAKEGWKDA